MRKPVLIKLDEDVWAEFKRQTLEKGVMVWKAIDELFRAAIAKPRGKKK